VADEVGQVLEHAIAGASGVRAAARARPLPSPRIVTGETLMQQENLFEDGSLSRPAAAALAVTALVAPALAALSDRPSRSLSTKVWYALLRKPRFNPPKALFPIVWTALDGALAVGAYRLARRPSTPERNRALGLFAANVAMITGWSRVFFGRHDLGAAAVGSAAIAATATAYVAAARPVDKPAAASAVPLVAWVAFATVLSTAVWRMNRD
jgi:tryptophan-rich sensory protein